MNRKLLLIGTVTVLGMAAAVAGAGDATRAVACDETAKTASISSCCAKTADASAASASSCTKGAAATTAAAKSACSRGASTQNAAASGCDKSAASAAAAAACEKGVAVAAGGAACCKAGKATAAGAKGKQACEKSKTASVFQGAVDELPYRENKRVVLIGAYACGHCNLQVTDGCSPMFKTADGKIYPLMKNLEASGLRAADAGNGVEIASSVRKIDGIKYLEVKSYKAQ